MLEGDVVSISSINDFGVEVAWRDSYVHIKYTMHKISDDIFSSFFFQFFKSKLNNSIHIYPWFYNMVVNTKLNTFFLDLVSSFPFLLLKLPSSWTMVWYSISNYVKTQICMTAYKFFLILLIAIT